MISYRHIISGFYLIILLLSWQSAWAAKQWYEVESDHFKVIYRDEHAALVPGILEAAEKALPPLAKIFNYTPDEKIIINTYDFSDYGKAGTTTIPHNFIRLEIAPLQLSYETTPFNNRIQWIISHELVHIIINDQAGEYERFNRKLYSKVPPEKAQPLTVLYSRLTNSRRYTPRWHQEAIAIFMETWLSGGYGRILGNFDEMYFRTMVYENVAFPSPQILEAKTSHNSFLLETLFYLYGARFSAYLGSEYGVDKLIDWFTVSEKQEYTDFEDKFHRVFGEDLETIWFRFIKEEKNFQSKNIRNLEKQPLTTTKPLTDEGLGWVTAAYFDPHNQEVLFGYHRPHRLTKLVRLDVKSKSVQTIGSLPSPSMVGIASTAYDKSNQFLFYTTNNNKLFRDIHVRNTVTNEKKLLFPDCRVGDLTVSEKTHELYGIRHKGGKTELVYSAYPYRKLIAIVDLGIENHLQHLAISPSGKYLAATLHRPGGSQAVIMADLQALKKGSNLTYQVIIDDGSPEYPSWSGDGRYLYYNAYVNGVSNIYRYSMKSGKSLALSHTIRGLFQPVALNSDSVLAFEFTVEGFKPVIIDNSPAKQLPAIEYYGQRVLAENPDIRSWPLEPNEEKMNIKNEAADGRQHYSALRHIHFHSVMPIVTGFQSQKAIGMYTHLADPLYIHDVQIEMGVTPYRLNLPVPRFHFKGRYEYRRRLKFGVDHNAPNFFDLANERKRSMIGNKFTATHTKFWKYDIPHKIKQVSEVALYTGIKAINDNLVLVSRPDFVVMQSALTSANIRRSIGSVDSEKGSELSLTGMFFAVEPHKNADMVGGFHAEAGYYLPALFPHNILHFKLMGGYRRTLDDMAIGKFYFGGFGNRYLEDGKIRQYRKVFRFPGIPIYSLATDRFVKGLIEHSSPPYRPGGIHLGHHYLSYINASWYSQGLWLNSPRSKLWLSLGAQINFNFKHWYNLQSTLSLGAARAWWQDHHNNEWFISLKLFKD